MSRSPNDDREAEWVPYERILIDTHRAWTLKFPDIAKPICLPKSECDIDEEAEEIEVPAWLIVEHGIA